MQHSGGPKSFEAAIKRLEEIVSALEAGDKSLEDSLKMFEEGMALAKFCTEKLNQAEKKLMKLVKKEDGGFQLELI
ncbi:exodeoxyribonuclease VII small subunit [candidate division KSB1 bacterium]|nr:exodeoxyribonuclease VII small subunit [bacterium]OQX60216.1 MAG: exodeoxyribonuclease VII small subunit [candidate division KSB1 bacterium 4484_219]RKY85409.1 MAG: exodeoxyribonuclease VII small subunit [candidate division KSB1 bacterium]RKY92008.1 MAG: exodeoxyribonuclease VII small subunit [candidate division KSB1 bacterium]HEC32093.1 exodeoxyribonuclease VII small subunit [Deltaproteobacteria bacterium]